MNSCYYRPLPLRLLKVCSRVRYLLFFPKSTTQGLISMITKLLPQLPLTVPEAASAHLPLGQFDVQRERLSTPSSTAVSERIE